MRFDGLWTSPLLASSSTHPASLSVRVPTVAGLPAASFSLALAGSALQSSYRYHHRFGRVHFISIVQAHAGHTSAGVPPAAFGVLAERFPHGNKSARRLRACSCNQLVRGGPARRDADRCDRDGRAPHFD